MEKERWITQSTITAEYGMNRSMIERFLPPPKLKQNPHYKSAAPMRLWKESDVKKAIRSNKKLKSTLDTRKQKAEVRLAEKRKSIEETDRFLEQFSPKDLLEQGKKLARHFTLHIGPTNSGKTYDAIAALKKAGSGMYLGPLRLLALEMFETLNQDGVLCNLLTGEEYEPIPGATITASTIELCDYSQHVDVVVIDEAQLISDSFRGSSWTSAICLVDADEVHVCMAPEAQSLIEHLLQEMETPYDIVNHERLVPLEFKGVLKDISMVEPGDALITFSRRGVLSIAAALEKQGIQASVIYGALPPAARREETRKFAEKETSVVVATDAIGMGISLPIRRVIFVQTEKFDGQDVRPLMPSEIKQIAGRAGRFGKYDLGEVLTMMSKSRIAKGLEEEVPPVEQLHIAFPKEALQSEMSLEQLLHRWNQLPPQPLYRREDMTEAETLLHRLGSMARRISKEEVFALISCPVDLKNDQLVWYWQECCAHIIEGEPLEKPHFSESTLESCEMKYQAYDIYHQLLRRIGIEDDCMKEKEILCQKINHFLLQKKKGYLSRCKRCGKELPITSRFGICEDCFMSRNYRW